MVSKRHWFAMVTQAALKTWSGTNLIWCFAIWDSWLSPFALFRASNSLEVRLRFVVEAEFFASSNLSVTVCSCLSLLNLPEGVVKRILQHSPCAVLQGFITGSQEKEKKDRQGNHLKRVVWFTVVWFTVVWRKCTARTKESCPGFLEIFYVLILICEFFFTF